MITKNIKSLLKSKAAPVAKKQEIQSNGYATEEIKDEYSESFCKSLQIDAKEHPLETYKVPDSDTAYYVKNYITKD